ncbi:MAG TPA: MBL fold metallo-hydrolase [Xanthobacteraceae bacterium]|nr:MBL fold metallo-hydrolase [Bradyrhizobium sp.]HKS61953.1 MBL fold metallo-hydrolase [Xanthobacteraceae bacterium]
MIALTRRALLGAAAATTAASSLSIPAQAAAPMLGKQGPSFYRYKIGDFEVTALSEGSVRNANVKNMAVNKDLPDIEKALGAAFLPTDAVTNQFTILVVNTGKNLVLIDSGFGDNGAPTVGNLAGNLTAAGIDPKNVDTILVSHFHGDHISGIRAKAGAANFPNAEIMVPAGEWKHWNDAGEESKAPQVWKGGFANVKRVFDPIAKDVKQFEHGKELVPGISSVDARGHSPGHTAFVVASGNGKLLVTSDTVNHQILVRNPDWSLWADMDPAMAVTARKRLLDMAAADRMQIAAYHLPFPSTGFISKQGGGYEFHPAYWQPVL